MLGKYLYFLIVYLNVFSTTTDAETVFADIWLRNNNGPYQYGDTLDVDFVVIADMQVGDDTSVCIHATPGLQLHPGGPMFRYFLLDEFDEWQPIIMPPTLTSQSVNGTSSQITYTSCDHSEWKIEGTQSATVSADVHSGQELIVTILCEVEPSSTISQNQTESIDIEMPYFDFHWNEVASDEQKYVGIGGIATATLLLSFPKVKIDMWSVMFSMPLTSDLNIPMVTIVNASLSEVGANVPCDSNCVAAINDEWHLNATSVVTEKDVATTSCHTALQVTNGNVGHGDNEALFSLQVRIEDSLDMVNGSQLWVTVAVFLEGTHIWVGQIPVIVLVDDDRQPMIDYSVTMTTAPPIRQGDTLELCAEVWHYAIQAYAWNAKLNIIASPKVQFSGLSNYNDVTMSTIPMVTRKTPSLTELALSNITFSTHVNLCFEMIIGQGGSESVHNFVGAAEVVYSTHSGIQLSLPLKSVQFQYNVTVDDLSPGSLLLFEDDGVTYLCAPTTVKRFGTCVIGNVDGRWIGLHPWIHRLLAWNELSGDLYGTLYSPNDDVAGYMKSDDDGKSWIALSSRQWSDVMATDGFSGISTLTFDEFVPSTFLRLPKTGTYYQREPEPAELNELYECSSPLRDIDDWWRIDLGDNYDIYKLKVLGSCSQDWLTQSTSSIMHGYQCGDPLQADELLQQEITRKCSVNGVQGILGRFITVQLTGTKMCMNFCEIDAYAEINHKMVNVAVNKSTSQSSVIYGGYGSRVVDGNKSPLWSGYSCMHTRNEFEPHLLIDLEERYSILEVNFTNRQRACWKRSYNLTAVIGDYVADGGACSPLSQVDGHFEYDCGNNGVRGRIVTLRHVDNVTLPTTVCELSAYTKVMVTEHSYLIGGTEVCRW
ncbi:uncharacterized protein [Ptychodera flava]|uniref:uncharacterized protein isoform X2 n=1 Tax=Ptychodera flava TaxID=63121 RepID=UPI00396A6875